jgi:hypothetical protein
VLGPVLVVVGLIWVWIGDKRIPAKGGRVLRMFSYLDGYMRWMKWPMGLALVYVGVEILLHH